MKQALRWNDDKKHRCPACHTVAVPYRPSSVRVYTCCRSTCGATFTRWPWLARLLPKAGIVCDEYPHVWEEP